MQKTCSKCGIHKTLEEFHVDRRSPDGRQSSCKACRKAASEARKERKKKYDQQRYAAQKEKVKRAVRKWQSNNPEKVQQYKLKNALSRRYSLTVEEYQELLISQGGVCAICGGSDEQQAFVVDHDHNTGQVRGILCHRCNCMLGFGRDDTTILQAGIEYLKESK